jgi:hypothetical protein
MHACNALNVKNGTYTVPYRNIALGLQKDKFSAAAHACSAFHSSTIFHPSVFF